MIRPVLLASALLAAGCAHRVATPSAVAAGVWGGDQISLTVEPSGSGVITLACAGATFDGPIRLDVGGHFHVSGTYTQGSGAPVEPPAPAPANISGRLDRDGTLWLDVATADGPRVTSAQLRLNRKPVIHHCP